MVARGPGQGWPVGGPPGLWKAPGTLGITRSVAAPPGHAKPRTGGATPGRPGALRPQLAAADTLRPGGPGSTKKPRSRG